MERFESANCIFTENKSSLEARAINAAETSAHYTLATPMFPPGARVVDFHVYLPSRFLEIAQV